MRFLILQDPAEGWDIPVWHPDFRSAAASGTGMLSGSAGEPPPQVLKLRNPKPETLNPSSKASKPQVLKLRA